MQSEIFRNVDIVFVKLKLHKTQNCKVYVVKEKLVWEKKAAIFRYVWHYNISRPPGTQSWEIQRYLFFSSRIWNCKYWQDSRLPPAYFPPSHFRKKSFWKDESVSVFSKILSSYFLIFPNWKNFCFFWKKTSQLRWRRHFQETISIDTHSTTNLPPVVSFEKKTFFSEKKTTFFEKKKTNFIRIQEFSHFSRILWLWQFFLYFVTKNF